MSQRLLRATRTAEAADHQGRELSLIEVVWSVPLTRRGREATSLGGFSAFNICCLAGCILSVQMRFSQQNSLSTETHPEISGDVISNHNSGLASPSGLTVSRDMKNELSVSRKVYLRLLLMVPAICLLGFTGCSSVDAPAAIHSTANLLSAAVGKHKIGDRVTIGPRTYNSKDQSFDRPWPFGPESNPQ